MLIRRTSGVRTDAGVGVVLVVVLVLSACGGQAAEGAGRALARSQSADDVMRALDDLDNGNELLLRDAFCVGVDSYAEDGSLPSGQDWAGFLRNVLLQRADTSSGAVELADEFGEALEEGGDYSAGHYLRGCGFVG